VEHLPLTPAAQAVLKALAEIGQGNVHELAEKSGKARSTTDKAIRTLADAGLIVAAAVDGDPADGTPTRWILSDEAASALDEADLSDEAAASPDETDTDAVSGEDDEPGTDDDGQAADTGDGDDDVQDEASSQPEEDADDTDHGNGESGDKPTTAVVMPTRPGDRKVMAIKGVLADHSDGAAIEVIVAESGISYPTTVRLLAAMEQADAARRKPGPSERWIAGPTKASEVDPNPEPPRCPMCVQVIRGVTTTPEAVAAVQSLIRPDGTLHIVGPDTQIHIVTLPTRLPSRPVNGSPTAVNRPSDVTVNGDGSQPFGRGELEKLTIGVLAANPDRPMTPQDIATVISGQLGGRAVSSGAVRNNCTKLGAAGRVLLAAESPLTFVYPAPDEDTGTSGEPVEGLDQQSTDTDQTAAEPEAEEHPTEPADGADQES
jgi:DNA-binding transcriptional ArsR family regulator